MDRIITSTELQRLKPRELSALFAKVAAEAGRHAPGTVQRRNAVASLDNIARALAAPKPPTS